MTRPLPTLALLLLSTLWAATTVASEPACDQDVTGPWIGVVLSGWQQDETILLDELRYGVPDPAFQVCRLNEENALDAPILLEIRVQDGQATMQTRVSAENGARQSFPSRVVDLAELPVDAHSVAIVVASEEMMSAAFDFYEQGLEEEPVPIPPVAAPPAQLVVDPEPTQPSSLLIGGRFNVEHYTVGQTWVGGDGFLRYRFWAPLFLEAALGGRSGLTIEDTLGVATAAGVSSGLALGVELFRTSFFLLEVSAGLRTVWIRYQAEPRADASSSAEDGVGVQARAVLGMAFDLGDVVFLHIGGGAGVPLRALNARSDQRSVGGMSGAELLGLIGLGVRL